MNPLNLIQSETLRRQANYADQQVHRQKLAAKQAPGYTYRGFDAESGQAVASAGDSTAKGRSITNGFAKPGQSVSVLQSGNAIDINSMPRVKRIAQAVPVANGDKVKTLHSQIEGDERVFYLWGDRPTPKRIFAITKDSRILVAKINNLGDEKWIVGLRWESLNENYVNQQGLNRPLVRTQNFSNSNAWAGTTAIAQLDAIPITTANLDLYMGYGFWLFIDYGYASVDSTPTRQPTTYIFYKDALQSIPGTLSFSAAGNLITSIVTTVTVPVSLTETRVSTDQYQSFNNPATEVYSGQITFPQLFGNKRGFYFYLPDGRFSARQYKLTPDVTIPENFDPATGFPFAMTDANVLQTFGGANAGGGQIFGSRYFDVTSSFSAAYNATSNQWNVNIYTIGATTTKKSVKTKVTCKLVSGQFFHSASYHP